MPARRGTLLLLGLAAAVHLALAAALPLSGDEAYLWDCARHPAWSYFDLPPLMPWLIAPFRLLFGETAVAVRLPAVLCSLLLGLFLLPLFRRLGGNDRQAGGAYLLLHATPLFFLGSFYASTDIGMTTAYVGAVAAALAIADGEEWGWWAFGLAMGMGFLAKFTMVLALPMVIPAALSTAGRRHLRGYVPWLAALLSILSTAPVWIWSSHHDWADMRFQLAGRHKSSGFTAQYLTEFLVASLLLASPFLVVAGWIALSKLRKGGGARAQIILVAIAFPLVFFALVSLRVRVGGHWGAPSLVILISLVPLFFRPWRRALILAGSVSTAFIVVATFMIVSNPLPILALPLSYRGNPVRINTSYLAWLVGNEEVAAAVRLRLRPGEMMASENYTNVHLFAFLSGGTMETRLADVKLGKSGLGSLYWYEPSELRGRNFLMVTEKFRGDDALRTIFREVTEESPVLVRRGGRVVRSFRILRCRDLLQPQRYFSRLRAGEHR